MSRAQARMCPTCRDYLDAEDFAPGAMRCLMCSKGTAFTCPDCDRTSYNPEGFCDYCEDAPESAARLAAQRDEALWLRTGERSQRAHP